jgi:hypothetical protein
VAGLAKVLGLQNIGWCVVKREYRGRLSGGGSFSVQGIDSPVPGLALVDAGPCHQCGSAVFGVLHVRSGGGLFFTHGVENLGREVWSALATADWTRAAAELVDAPVALAAMERAFGLVPDAFQADPMDELSDLPHESAPDNGR